MIKAFLSHSWAQKQFVDDVANYLGHDMVVVDRFVFESGRKIEDEISASLDFTSVFVLLVSNEALDSDWCKYELNNIRDYIDEGKCIFCAFLIDKNVSVSDPRIKKWVRNYLTNYYDNAHTLARVIKRQIKELVWSDYPHLLIKEKVYVGRDDDFKNVVGKIYGNMDSNIRGVVVSGLPHIGRKRFLQEVINTKLGNEFHPSYDPFDVSMSDNDSLDIFIKQLNELVALYSNEELNDLMRDVKNYKGIAVNLLNRTIDLHERVRISDDSCIVNSNGYYEDWFLDVIQDPGLTNVISIFVSSTCAVNPVAQRENKKIVHVQLDTLTNQDMKVLFNKYSKAREISCSESKTSELLKNLSGYPGQVFMLVDDIHDYGMAEAEQQLPVIRSFYDSDINKLIDKVCCDDKSMQLFVLLSKFPSIKYDHLKELYNDPDFDSLLSKMQRYSVYESFGSNRQYIRMSHALSDYVSRYDLKLDKRLQDAVKEYVENIITTADISGLDWTDEIVRGKALLSDKRFKVEAIDTLLPSVVLQSIIEQYRDGEYEGVVDLAKKILYDSNRNDYESMQRSVRYWLCLSYCKLGENYRTALEEEVSNFTGYTKYFLLGYFERKQEHYPQAQRFFELAMDSSSGKGKHTSKAAHELVITKMKQGLYGDALEQSEINYNADPRNIYHIDAYFRCYIRSVNPDKSVLRRLISEMSSSYNSGKDVFVQIFEAEYLYYIDRKPQAAVEKLTAVIASERGRHSVYALESLYNVCRKQSMMSVYDNVIKKHGLNQ